MDGEPFCFTVQLRILDELWTRYIPWGPLPYSPAEGRDFVCLTTLSDLVFLDRYTYIYITKPSRSIYFSSFLGHDSNIIPSIPVSYRKSSPEKVMDTTWGPLWG